jgi:type IV pilus assembly protein PilV
MQAGRVSIFRQHAVTLASDVADRIRANPRAGAVYALDETADNCVAVAINCTPAEMAGNDIALWRQQAGQSLPAGATVDVQFDNGVVPPLYQITVSWPEPGQPAPMSYSVTIPVFAF